MIKVIVVAVVMALLVLLFGGFYSFLFATAFLVILLRASLYDKILANHYGELRFFGWRAPTSWLIKKGWGFWIPPLLGGRVASFSLLNQKISGEAEFVTADKSRAAESGVHGREVILKLPWYIEFVIDPTVEDGNGRVRFLGLDQAVMQEGISSYLHSKMSKLGGQLSSNEVVAQLREIEDYLRAFLQFEKPPHKQDEDVTGETDLLAWYRDHQKELKEAKDKRASSHSELEQEYGIRIRAFRIKFPEYTDETLRAIEKEHQAVKRAEAGDQLRKTAKKIKDDLGVNGAEALGAAKQIHELPNVQEVIISGGEGSLPIINLLGGTQAHGKGGKKGGRS